MSGEEMGLCPGLVLNIPLVAGRCERKETIMDARAVAPASMRDTSIAVVGSQTAHIEDASSVGHPHFRGAARSHRAVYRTPTRLSSRPEMTKLQFFVVSTKVVLQSMTFPLYDVCKS